MSNPVLTIDTEHTLGTVGLFLMLVVAALANHGFTVQQTVSGRASSFLARRAIDSIAVIGWVADHVAPPAGTNGRR